MLKHTFFLAKNQSSQKLLHYILIVTIVFFADAILAFWLPTYLDLTFSSSMIMGLIISFSSVVGLATDFLFPQLFPSISEKKTLNFTLFFLAGFIGLLMLSLQFPYWWIFILAVSSWGIYYEFLTFASKMYVSEHVNKKLYTNAWAEIDLGKSFAYLLGPIVASILLVRGNFSVIIASLIALILAQLLLSFFKENNKETKEPDKTQPIAIQPAMELSHWVSLGKKVWPVILLNFLTTSIDATFWTTGAVFAEKTVASYPLAIFIMPLYMAPMLIAQVILIKKGININKEKKATLLLIINALLLIILGSIQVGHGVLLTTFAIGLLVSFAYPLIESSYSDLEERMGIHKKHLIALSSSIYSLAYIIAPITAGFIGDLFGEQKSFSYLGIMVGFFAVITLILNRKKITIPQKEITTWDTK
ncbi:MAG: MFS transporter [Patescibacteria group bacterium]